MGFLCLYNGTLYGIQTKLNIGFISNSFISKIDTKILLLLNLKLRGRNAAEMLFFLEKKKNGFYKRVWFIYVSTMVLCIIQTELNICNTLSLQK
jgi:hypothetical protein